MRVLYVVVEGQTEEVFVRDTLRSHLATFDVHPTPFTVVTRRFPSGGKVSGGNYWPHVKRDVLRLLGDSQAAAVTTMFDLYGLSPDWPGFPAHKLKARQRALEVERAMAENMRNERFIPHLCLHEFESLLFVSPEACAIQAGRPKLGERLAAEVKKAGSHEEIDEGPNTAPSKRMKKHWPSYAKTTDGPAIVARIGVEAIRGECPHFSSWLNALESLKG